MASRTLADRSRHGLRRRRRRGALRSTDGGKSWSELSGLRTHTTGSAWQPGAGGMCLHTILLDPTLRSASSPRSPRPARFAATTPARRGIPSFADCILPRSPIPTPRSATACIASRCIPRADVLFMQKHWDVMRSDMPAALARSQRQSAHRFLASIDVHAHEPETIYVVPIKSDAEHFPTEGKPSVSAPAAAGRWEALTNGLPQRDCYVEHVCAMRWRSIRLIPAASISARPAGRCMPRPDAGDTWSADRALIFPPCSRSKCKRCRDPRRSAAASAHALARVEDEVQVELDGQGDA